MTSNRNYDDPLYKAWRVAVFKRDRFRCQFPGCTCKTKLNAHHIIRWADAPSLRFEITNGITLCRMHHKLISGAEHCFMKLFGDIVRGKPKSK